MAFQPAAGIGHQREAGSVALGEAVAAEALDAFEGLLGVLAAVAPGEHAGQQLLAMRFQAAAALPCRHRAPQLVGLAGREAGGIDGDLHDLLLEQRYAERALEDVF